MQPRHLPKQPPVNRVPQLLYQQHTPLLQELGPQCGKALLEQADVAAAKRVYDGLVGLQSVAGYQGG